MEDILVYKERKFFFNDIFERLDKSKFRSSFHLKEKDINYINKVGLNKINDHAYDFINKRLAMKVI